MPDYNLEDLGSEKFEHMCQALLKAVLKAPGTITFGSGKDAAREATFNGKLEYPSSEQCWDGHWIFQVKFHDTTLVGHRDARFELLTELDKELDKIVNKYKHPCDNYILLTNVRLSATYQTGTHDKAQDIAAKYKSIRHVHVWGGDEICRHLDNHPALCRSYVHLLTPAQLIADVIVEREAIRRTAHHPNNLPFPPNPHFTGREEMLEKLHHRLADKTAAAVTQTQAIHGLGGVGKTQLAVEYAWKYSSEYEALLWVVADSPENVEDNLAALCRPDALNLPEATETAKDLQMDAVRRWLGNNFRWLLIFDSVDSTEAASAVRNFLLPVFKGHVIITSRLRDWQKIPSVFVLTMGVLPEERAADFLCERVSNRDFNPGQREDALKLAIELGGLPLALEQAAAYVLRHCVTYADYSRLFEECRQELLSEEVEGGTRYKRSVAATWLITEKQLSVTARTILRLSAFLAPDNIPRALFVDDNHSLQEAVKLLAAGNEEELPETRHRLSVESAIVELADLSVITLTPKVFSCHRLMQAIIQDYSIGGTMHQRWVEFALLLIEEYMPFRSDDVRNWPIWESLRISIEPLVNYADKLAIMEPTARLMSVLSVFLNARALYQEAEPLMRRALTMAEKTFGPKHPRVAIRLNNLAQLLKATNRLTEAEPLMRRALAIDKQSFGENHPRVVIELNNLGQLLQATNRFAEAEPLMRRALTIAEQTLDLEHSHAATELSNLAALLQVTNRFAEAEPLIRRAIAITEQSLGPEHPDIAIRFNNLAQLLQATNRFTEAEPLMRRALTIAEQTLGPEHSNVVIYLNSLAQLLQATNRFAEAEPLIRRAIAIAEKSLGPEHPHVATSFNNLAQLLQATNRLTEAEPFMRRALAITEQSLGPEHPDIAIRFNNLAQLLQATNRFAEAEPLMHRAIAIAEQSFGSEHPDVAIYLNNLAALLKATNRFVEAESFMRRAIAIAEQSFGSEHPDIAIYFNNLAQLLKATNRFAEAESLLRRHLIIFRKFGEVTGHEHPYMKTAIINYRSFLLEMKIPEEEIQKKIQEAIG